MSSNPNDIDSLPPIWPSQKFNTYLFQGNNYLTRQQADLLYASVYSIRNIGYLNDITPGIISPSKSVIVDSSKNIIGFNNIQSTTIDCDGLNINNSKDLNLYGTTNSIHMHSSTSSTILMSSSIFNSITMQASAGFILMSGNNQYIYLSGTSNYLKIDNTEASSSSTTGTIRTAGGIYAGNNSLFNQNLLVNGTQTLVGSLLISGTITFQSTNGINMNSNNISNCNQFTLSGIQTSTNTATSSSYSTGALILNGGIGIGLIDDATSSTNGGSFTTRGGMAIAKSLYVGANITTNTLNGKTISLTNSGGQPSITLTCGANNLCQNFYTTDSTTWEVGVRGSTASSGVVSGNSYYIYNGDFKLSIDSSGKIYTYNTSSSTTSTNNAFQISGGLFVNNQFLYNGYIAPNGQFTGSNRSGSTRAISLYDNAIYFRGQNNNDTNHGLMYSGNGNSNWNSGKGFGNPSSGIDGPVLYGNSGVSIGNLNGTQTETLCATFVNTTTSLLGKVNINSPNYTNSQLNIQSFSNHLSLVYSSSVYATLSTGASYFQLATTNTSAVQSTQTYNLIFDTPSQVAGSTTTYPRMSLSNTFVIPGGNEHRLDMGDVPANFIIQIYNPNTGSGRNGSPSSGLGAANYAITYTSSLVNGHYFYSSYGLSGVGSQTSLGTYLAKITKDGNIESSNGLRAVGYNPNYSGSGAEIHYASNIASFFGYDRTSMLFKTTQLGQSLYVNGTTGFVSIGTNDGSKAPLYVSGTSGSSYTGGFGYLNSGGAGGASNFTNRQFSARFTGALFCESGEINCASDIRLKKDINNISDTLAINFIKKIEPIEFKYKDSEQIHYGYSAQDLIKEKYNILVGYTQADDELEEQILINDNNESITIPKDTRLIVNLLSAIPLLHKTIKILYSRIEKLEELVKINDERLDEVIDHLNSE